MMHYLLIKSSLLFLEILMFILGHKFWKKIKSALLTQKGKYINSSLNLKFLQTGLLIC